MKSENHSKKVLSVQVVLKSAKGVAPAPDAVITAATLKEYIPSLKATHMVQTFFKSHGFEVGTFVGISFSISGSAGLFQDCFGIDREDFIFHIEKNIGFEWPLSTLPADIRQLVAAVVITPPPDFGPGNP